MINFSGIPQRSGTWAYLKPLIVAKVLKVQFEEDPDIYLVYGYDLPEVVTCTIWKGAVPSGGDQTQNDLDRADFETNYKPYANRRVSPASSGAGIPLVSSVPREGREVVYATHNLCDQTTWYGESERVTSAVLAESGGSWSAGDAHWINMTGGKVFDERSRIKDQREAHPGDPHGFGVVVTVDGVEQVQRAPFATSGGDYTIDYAAGAVTPTSGPWTGSTVLASYSKKAGHGWIFRPIPGRSVVIEKSEVQFSADIGMTSGVKIEVYGLVDIFAPQLLEANGGPLPSGTPIPIEETVYDTVDQMIDEAVGMHPPVPTLSAGTGRGYAQPRYLFEFFYATGRPLFSSLGMFMRISIDEAFSGERATATFYATSRIDPGVEAATAILLSLG